jgi:hypothetical protein
MVCKLANLAQNDVDAINRIGQLEETVGATAVVRPLSSPEATVHGVQTAVVLPQLPLSSDRWKPQIDSPVNLGAERRSRPRNSFGRRRGLWRHKGQGKHGRTAIW